MSSSKAVRSKTTNVLESVPHFVGAVPFTGNVIVGEVANCEPDGSILVDYPHNSYGPLPARTLVEDLFLGTKVLLAFEMGDPTLPIVLGIVHERARTNGKTIHLRADRIVLEAAEELLLKCAECNLHARKNGTVHLKGREIVTRASRTNKIRGAAVRIN